MAKTKERKALKKGKAAFNLIGRVKVTDKTFNLDNSYDSGWTDNSMYVGVDCGNCNIVYIRQECDKFYPIRKVSYIYDRWDLIKKGSKDSPADMPNKVYNFLLKHRVLYDESERRKLRDWQERQVKN